MKIYITRGSAESVLIGGLKRLYVWFEKPTYMEFKRIDPKKIPFRMSHKSGMYGGGYWRVDVGGEVEERSFSFGRVFGYADSKDKDLNKIAKYVWKKLVEHFGGKPMSDDWAQREKFGLSKKENFLLEIDVSIQMNKKQKPR